MVAERPPKESAPPPRPATALPSALAWRTLGAVLGALVVWCCLTPQPASARDMTGKGGVGLIQSLDADLRRTPAFTFRYWRDGWAFETLVAIDWLQRERPLDDVREAQGGLGVLVRVVDTMELSVSVGLRGWAHYAWTISDPTGEEESWLGLLFELPLQAEFFLSDHSSILASVGPSVLLTDRFKSSLDRRSGPSQALAGPDSDLDKRGGVIVRLGGDYSGGIGYTYYF